MGESCQDSESSVGQKAAQSQREYYVIYVAAGVVLMMAQPILVTLSHNSEGKREYSSVSSTLLSEALKIAISFVLLIRNRPSNRMRFELSQVLGYSVPAIIYFVNNNLQFAILSHVNATTYQLLSQLKIVFTGLLFRIFLSKRLSMAQYLAIWQLGCGAAVSQLPTAEVASALVDRSPLRGMLLSMVSCLLSAFGGIYSEKLLKDRAADSIHWQNIQLYSWGVFFNLLGVLANGDTVRLLEGYNSYAVAVVINNAFNGLVISAILKYADNIARVYAHAVAMIVTMVVSIPLFGQQPTPQLLLAVAIVAASALQYNMTPEQLTSVHSAPKLPEHQELPQKADAN